MNVTRTFDLVDNLMERLQRDDALAVKRDGVWEKVSTSAYKEMVDNFSYGLLAMGLSKGDKIVSISNNRPEWNYMDMGMSQIGCVHVPIYANLGHDEYKHILTHSDARLIIVSSDEFYGKIKTPSLEAPNIEHIFCFDPVEGLKSWTDIIDVGKNNASKFKEELVNIKASIAEDDILSIIYTSGTTGLSKGVMLSHRNFISNVHGCINRLPVASAGKFVSFLPLCHVFERMVNYLLQYQGVAIYYAESIDTLGDNIREVNPEGFCAVPRVIEKLFDKIMLKGKNLAGIKKALFFWAVNLGLRYELNGTNGWWYEFQLKIANKLIFTKWREALGGNIQVIVSGGAPLQARLARIFSAAKLIVQEGYGLTETSPVIAVNKNHYPYLKFGTVGPLIENVEVKIAADGEILMKGPSLMMGYYKDEKKTNEAIDKDGWFHTGDIGEIQEHDILKITDRKKEIFKLSTGKYVAPQVVENIFKESAFIEQAMVVGEGKKYAAAIISPAYHFLHGWCFKKGVKYHNNNDLITNSKVIARYQKEIDKINPKLGQHQQLKKFQLVDQEWTPETGELSPTLKVKRQFLSDKYKEKIALLFEE
ncbi:MAG: long-chain fatty acid--CoA ligase [Bacteroidales bacterium]|jgi:long-chain acyl-CoA synthetase|nr:long-chain fatty acid--CoA ligase [Lentimicrobiaceae bacterium]MDG1136296.1 long-chain fatty acid--CoA ligase [Bacteroidales bacterium]MDG1902208.1 long-chain fatty acid--CoA ligase [Bacteroidales bacterium]MDG2080170.1 long-chain fatty acid--CoA ligase [Bacteroidales bacterium]|tara:strand:+ start:5221 stop:6993 length:1773 start_codon:yes stop_codon:yes gene_type:complete